MKKIMLIVLFGSFLIACVESIDCNHLFFYLEHEMEIAWEGLKR